jgi:hypothetical protein
VIGNFLHLGSGGRRRPLIKVKASRPAVGPD